MFEATESQWNFLNVLVEERVLTDTELQYLDDAIMGSRDVTPSTLIEWLQARPKNPAHLVEPGIYYHEAEFYFVREAARTDNRYATKLITSGTAPNDYEWRYVPGAISLLEPGDRVLPHIEAVYMNKYPVKNKMRSTP